MADQDREAGSGGMSLTRFIWIAAGGLGGVILLLFIVGLLLALFADVDSTASRIQIVRDIFIIVLSLEFILIIISLALLILQVARLVNLVQNEVGPTLQNIRDAANVTRGTAQFVGENVAEPIIKTAAFVSGVGVFLREMGGIRRAIRSNGRRESLESGRER
jgi:hypothetical protein